MHGWKTDRLSFIVSLDICVENIDQVVEKDLLYTHLSPTLITDPSIGEPDDPETSCN